MKINFVNISATFLCVKKKWKWYQPGSVYCLLRFWCRDYVLVKLCFRCFHLFFLSRCRHIWFHRLRGLLFVVGTFCTTLREQKSHCIELTKQCAGVTKVTINTYETEDNGGGNESEEIGWFKQKQNKTKKTYSNAKEVWEVSSSSFAAGPSLKRTDILSLNRS